MLVMLAAVETNLQRTSTRPFGLIVSSARQQGVLAILFVEPQDLGGWHDFRHSVATSMLRAGHGVKVVSELLGHSDVSITLRTYDHAESDAFRAPLNEAANQLL